MKKLRRFLKWVLYAGVGIVFLAGAGALLQGIHVITQPEPTARPTHTLIPGQATLVFLGVNEIKAASGTPTDPPGPGNATQVQLLIEGTLAGTRTPVSSNTPQPTHTLKPTNTSAPTHTSVPTNTLRPTVPGVPTVIHEGVIEAQATAGQATMTPGAPFEVFVNQAVQASLTAGYRTATPTPTPTP